MDEAFHLIKVTNIYQLFCQNPPLSGSVRPQNQKKIRNRPAAEELWPLRQRINEIFFFNGITNVYYRPRLHCYGDYSPALARQENPEENYPFE